MKHDPLTELPAFLAYSLELEKESAERLREFSAIMRTHNQHELAETFERLAHYSDKHAAEVEAICGDRELPEIPAWEFDWPGAEPPETCRYESLGYDMSVRQALEAMLAQERDSAAFYQSVADRSGNDEIRDYAAQFAQEEREHAAALESWLGKLDEGTAPAPDIDPPREID